MNDIQTRIEEAYEQRTSLTPEAKNTLRPIILSILMELDRGTLRVAEKLQGEWITHTWLKKAILLSFTVLDNELISGGSMPYFDKLPAKCAQFTEAQFKEQHLRIVPGTYIRKGAFLGPHTVLMPSFVNVGAYVGAGTLIDTWATVGSCAQIGQDVHISGGTGIGGVLEPLQANPTIIEDHCFIGARSEIVEGVVIEENSVISMGVFIGQSTPIYDRQSGKITYGRVPAGSVVVAGSLPNQGCHLYCAVIVKKVDAQTRQKVAINEILRGI